MAERLNKRQADTTRAKIQASQLINRLQNHVDGNCEMSTSQLRAAEILLKKSLPDLQSVEVDVEGDVGLTVNMVSQIGNNPSKS